MQCQWAVCVPHLDHVRMRDEAVPVRVELLEHLPHPLESLAVCRQAVRDRPQRHLFQPTVPACDKARVAPCQLAG